MKKLFNLWVYIDKYGDEFSLGREYKVRKEGAKRTYLYQELNTIIPFETIKKDFPLLDIRMVRVQNQYAPEQVRKTLLVRVW